MYLFLLQTTESQSPIRIAVHAHSPRTHAGQLVRLSATCTATQLNA